LDHYQKREQDSDSVLDNIVIGALLGTSDAHGKQVIDISNSFQMIMKVVKDKSD
jgi:hypothetical protein